MQSLRGISGFPKLVESIFWDTYCAVVTVHYPFLLMYRVTTQDVNFGKVIVPYSVRQVSIRVQLEISQEALRTNSTSASKILWRHPVCWYKALLQDLIGGDPALLARNCICNSHHIPCNCFFTAWNKYSKKSRLNLPHPLKISEGCSIKKIFIADLK